MNELIDLINDQCCEHFRITTTEHDYFELWNKGDIITEGDYYHVLDRLKQIAKENGVYKWWHYPGIKKMQFDKHN